MKAIPYNEGMVESAKRWGKRLGKLNNSITKGKGNLGGRLGEIAFASYIGAELEDDYNYAII